MSGVRKKRWKGPLPVSAVHGVLLKDNRFADMLLDDRLKQLRMDRGRAKNLLDWQQQSFVLNQAIKETELREMRVGHTSFLPEVAMKVTEPNVRARRPFGKVRRSASQMMEDLVSFEKRLSLPLLTTRRSLTLSEISLSAPAAGQRKPAGVKGIRESICSASPLDKTKGQLQSERHTHLHGIDLQMPRKSKTELNLRYARKGSLGADKRLCGRNLPLYGPEAEAEREEKEKRYVRHLQRKMGEMDISSDDRFMRLEKSLVRDSPEGNEEDWSRQAAGLTDLLNSETKKDDDNSGSDVDDEEDPAEEVASDDDSESDEEDDDERTVGYTSGFQRLSAKSTLDLTYAPDSNFF